MTRVSNGTAGCIKSFVLDTDYYSKGEYTVTPLSALGLGNGTHRIQVMTWIYVGKKDKNSAIIAPTKTPIIKLKILFFILLISFFNFIHFINKIIKIQQNFMTSFKILLIVFY
jgi:hypothetical protein